MGTDVWSESGIVICLNEACRAIPKRGFSTTILAVQKYVKSKIKRVAEDKDEKIAIKRLKRLMEVKNNDRDSFVEALCEFSAYRSGDRYEYDSYGFIFDVWKIIMKTSRPELPQLGELKVFDNGRECGWSVPVGEPVLIFDSSKLLKQVLTEKGRKFKRTFGSCSESTWSVMSY